MNLIINDKDITASDQSINKCKYFDYAGGHADVLQISFNDTDNQWRSWNLTKNDKIRIKKDKIDTGDMYISNISIEDGFYNLKSLSTPANALNEISNTRENIKLLEICNEICKELGFDLYTSGVQNYLYSYIERINQNPIAYLNSLLIKEGYLLKVFNNKLIVYSEKILENSAALIPITAEDFISKPTFETSDANILSSVENSYLHSSGLIKSKAVSGLFGKSKTYIFPVETIGEGERFCKNILRFHNKNEFTGSGYVAQSDITAGITIDLSGDFAEWQGINFVYEVIHDLINDKQFIKFRKPIKGDY